jgi:hypothetical protein
LVNGDTVTNVTLTSSGAAGTAGVGGSPYSIVASAAQGTGLTNYSITYSNGTLTVNAKAASVTANNTNKTYGDTVTFAGTEFSSSGLVNGDMVTNVTLTSAGAAAAAPAGSYDIVPSAATGGTFTAANYAISYANGTLTVISAQPTILSLTGAGTSGVVITWSAISNFTYRVQYQPNLNPTNWVDLAPDVTATNGTASATDNPGGAAQRFYRILVVH